MRLNDYIIEITKGTVPRVKAIFSKRLPDVKQELIRRKWNINDNSALEILNKYFIKNKIQFHLSKGKTYHGGKYVAYGESWDDGSVEIYLNKNFSKYWIKKFAVNPESFDDYDENQFFGEIFFTLSHELIHKKQSFKASGKGNEMGVDIFGDSPSELDYYSSKREVEAYAYQAYLEYMTQDGKSPIFDFYLTTFNKNDPVRKRFLKKFYQYLDQQDKLKS
jgi:hypothetical protein